MRLPPLRNGGATISDRTAIRKDRRTMKVANLGRAVKINRGGDIMKRDKVLMIVAVFGVLSMMVSVPIRQAYGGQAFVPPVVFQAAGPSAGLTETSIDLVVAEFRIALGIDNGNDAGPLGGGRREINWDGGGLATETT